MRTFQPRPLLHLLLALADADERRLCQLVARNDVTHVLDEVTRQLELDPPGKMFADQAEAIATVAVALIANLKNTGVTYRHMFITARLAKLLPSERQLAFYTDLIDRISRDTHRSRITREGGLYSLYIDAASVAFRAEQLELAFTWCCAALDLTDSLSDSLFGAKARLTGRIRYTTYLAYLDRDRVAALEPEAHAAVRRELLNVLSLDPPDSQLLQLQAALAQVTLLRSTDALNVRGRITAAEERIQLLHRTLADTYGLTCTDGLLHVPELQATAESVPLDEGRALGRVMVEIARSYARMGDGTRASWYVRESGRFHLSRRNLIDANIALGVATKDIAVAVELCEQFAREHVSGGLASLSDHQRARILGHYGVVGHSLANMLKANREYTGSAFWRLQARYWEAEKQEPGSLWTGGKVLAVSSAPDAPAADDEATGLSPVSGERLVVDYVAHVQELLARRAQPQPVAGPFPTQQRKSARPTAPRQRAAREVPHQPHQPHQPHHGDEAMASAAVAQQGDSQALLEDLTTPGSASMSAESSTDNRAQVTAGKLGEQCDNIGLVIAEEDVNDIIALLLAIARNQIVASDSGLGRKIHLALTAIVAWRPQLFGPVAARVRDCPQEGPALATVSLHVAIIFTRAYAPHRTVFFLLTLSERPGLDLPERLTLVQEAMDTARSQGRPVLELRSFRLRLGLLDELRGPVPDDEITAGLSDVLRRSHESTDRLGISGVFDRAFAMATELANLAEALAESDRARLAFRTSALAQGRITWALAQNPDSVVELNDAMKVHGSDDAVDLHRFHSTVLARICSSSAVTQDPPMPQDTGPSAEDPSDEGTVTIRFVGPSSGHVWAIGRGADASHFAVRLETTPVELADLADSVWFWIRDNIRPDERDDRLRWLWDACVAPLRSRLADADRVTFAFHDNIPFLPLHGALGPDGFLGATLPVDYEIQPGAPQSPVPDPDPAASLSDAAVLGWDPQTVSDQEVGAVTAVMGDAFTLVPTGDARSAVTDVVLNPHRELAVLHIAGHGHLLSYPRAMESSVELMPSVTVTALGFLTSGCRSRFVFLNVCGVGNPAATAGDSYGFALAVRSRGALAFLAPATYVSPEHAKTFATLFYAAALRHNTADAVHQVVRTLVARGAAPDSWMPYALFGRLPALV